MFLIAVSVIVAAGGVSVLFFANPTIGVGLLVFALITQIWGYWLAVDSFMAANQQDSRNAFEVIQGRLRHIEETLDRLYNLKR